MTYPMPIRFSISAKLLVLILPLICIPIATVGYFSFKASVDRVDRLVRHEQMVQVKATAAEINGIFYSCRLDLQTISSLPVLEDYHNARAFRLSAEAEFNHDNIVRLFADFIGRTPYYRQIRFIDQNGLELIRVGRDGSVPIPDMPERQAFVSYVLDAADDALHVSDLVRDRETNGWVIHWGRALFSGLKELTGAVVIDLDYPKIMKKVQDIQVEEHGYAFLIDGEGRLIAHPRLTPFSLHPGNFPTESMRAVVDEMITGANEWRSYDFEGEEKVAAFAPIPIMNWSLAVTIPRVAFKKDALAIRQRVVQAVAITLFFAVAGVSLLTYYLLKPVRTLVDATNRIAGGEMNHVIPIQSSDELGDLTRSFNRMVRNLSTIQNELVRSEKLISLGRLSAGVAHEIRNPLNAMKGAVVFLQRKRADDSLVSEYAKLVSEEIDRLSQFVTEFLLFARQAKPKKVPTDLNHLIVITKQLFEERARQANIRFHERLEKDLPRLLLDPHQIEQVLVNLIINAMDALPDGGDITFTTRLLRKASVPDGSQWMWLALQDNGNGIPADNFKNIFDPFFSTKEDGTGLGLPLSMGIVENHGGQIQIDSKEGIGTSVIIEWPVTEETTEQANSDIPENLTTNHGHNDSGR